MTDGTEESGSGFFDGLPPPPPRIREPDPPQPVWAGPPAGWVPGLAGSQAVLAKTEEMALVLHRFLAYPTGAEFTLEVWFRNRQSHFGRRGLFEVFHPPADEEIAEDSLKFGVQFPDGSKWTNRGDAWRPWMLEGVPSSPVLFPTGGGGSDHRWSQKFWMWPLPEDGEVKFALAWPALGIGECSATVDVAELRQAAQRAREFWPSADAG